MSRRFVVTIASACLLALGVTLGGDAFAQAPDSPPPPPPPRPPFRFVPLPPETPETHGGYVRCPDCAGDVAPTYVLQRDDVTFNISARPTARVDGVAAAGRTAITVTIQTATPSEIDAEQDFITLRDKDENREFLLAPADYKLGIYNLEQSEPRPASQSQWVDIASTASPPDEWPAARDVTESSLDFYVGADLLSGSFTVQLPKIMVNGKPFDLPPIQFDPQAAP